MTELAPQKQTKLKPDFVKYVANFFNRATSAFIILFGRRQSGKTDMGLLLAEIAREYAGIEFFASNVRTYNSPFPIERITNLEDLEFWCKSNTKRKLFFLDEAGKALRRRTPMSSLNIKLIDNLQILRKYKLSIIMATPAEKYVDNAALGEDVLDVVIEKPYFKNPKVALIADLLESETKTVTGIPRTNIAYDTYDVAPFTEKSKNHKPQFKDKDLQYLWDWSHGATAKSLGLFDMQMNRLVRKFIKEVLERDANGKHQEEIEVHVHEATVSEPENNP